MALEWVEEKGEELIKDLRNGKLYNGLTNDVHSDYLPLLSANNKFEFWENENSSTSTIMLYSIAKSLGIEVTDANLIGAATFYPYLSPEYSNNDNLSFFNRISGALLFGDYQFGGHRYFSNNDYKLGQMLFAPEDCSIAVGKATGLLDNQILGITTTSLRSSYNSTKNEYGYSSITSSSLDEIFSIESVMPGDVYVRGGHTAIFASSNNMGAIQTFQFNRDIDTKSAKLLGGGMCAYDLFDPSKTKSIYIY